MPLRIPRSLIYIFFAFTIFASTLHAQITGVTADQTPPIPGAGHDYIKMLNETVNPATGSVSIRIDLPVPAGRGLDLPFAFSYDSNSAFHRVDYNRFGDNSYNSGGYSGAGWNYLIPHMVSTNRHIQWKATNNNYPYDCSFRNDFVFTDLKGGSHQLGMAVFQTNNSGTACVYPYSSGQPSDFSNGGDDYVKSTATASFAFPVRVSDNDGTVYYFSDFTPSLPSWIESRNGNKITFTSNTSGFSATDSIGRTLISVNGFGASGNTVSISGFSNPYTITWGPISTNVTYAFQTTNVLGNNSPCGGSGSTSGSGTNITAITLPNSKAFQFEYDSITGLIKKIIYPNGGYTRYVWGVNHSSDIFGYYPDGDGDPACTMIYDTPAVSQRYVSFDGVTEVQRQDFTYTPPTWSSNKWSVKNTTVVTYDLLKGTSFETDYSYSPVGVAGSPYDGPYKVSSGNSINWGGVLSQYFPVEQTVTYKSTTGSVLKTSTKGWKDQYLLNCQLETLDNGYISGEFYTYGSGGQITDKKEYDFNIITSATACQNNSAAPASPTRETATTYQTFNSTPIYPGAFSIFDRPSSVITYGNGVKLAETDYAYDETTVSPVSAADHDDANYPSTYNNRANLTTLTKKCFVGATGCTNAVTKHTYDQTGQILATVDACGNSPCSDMSGSNHTTSYSYSDSYTSCSGAAPPLATSNAYVTTITDPLGHTRNFCYGYNDGQVRSSTDPNSLTTSYLYSDLLGRITQTTLPDGGQTTISYNDSVPSITKSVKQNSVPQYVTTTSIMDGVGHVKQTQLSDPQGTVYTDTTYDALGRVATVSNPYRTGTDPTGTPGIATYGYDAMGRKISETYPDNSILTTAYCGASTLVTDPTGKWRRSRTNGLGQLVEVDEPNAPGASVASTGCPGTGEPIWVTSYTNDVLGNLTQVVQNGSHTRTFTYDSLSHLLTSTNPEVGTITYAYDANSNVATKKDARNITTSYTYDALNRSTGSTYSNGDPSITITYDQANCLGLSTCSNIGQRTSMTDAAGSEAWAYQVDATNHRNVHVNQRTTTSTPSNITKTSTYVLDLAGNLTQITYPTGRVVNYTYNAANRPITATDGSSGITYASDFQTPPSGCLANAVCYTPQGTYYALSIGQSSTFTGLNLNHSYNNRLQPLEFKASSTGGNAIDVSYNFVDPASTHNAGHVYGIINNLDTTRSQTFTYDQLNRITSAQTTSNHSTSAAHCWGETYNLDAWANLLSIAPTTNSAYTGCSIESGFTKTADGNNHVSGFTYDTSGNTANDGTFAYTWDAESQLKSANNVNYLYDGSGRRVSKSNGKLYWYGSGGEILAETDASGNILNEYIFFGGQRIATMPAAPAPTVGGFEQGLSGWTATTTNLTAQLVTTPSSCHSGNNCLRLSDSVDTLSQYISPQSIPISVGQTATLDGWVFKETGTGNYSARWVMGIISTNGNAYPAPADDGTFGAWVHQTVSYTVPSWFPCPCTVQMYAQLVTNSGTLDVARFDDGVISVSDTGSGNGKPLYYVEDMLGTSRVMTDANGILCYDADFYPYGGERPYTNTCSPVYKFEGKERDTETGNDDFGARYYSNRFGRWLSADWSSVPIAVPYANLTNPQTLNLYSMVHDDPESFADLDGHIGCFSKSFLECPHGNTSQDNQAQNLQGPRSYISENKDANTATLTTTETIKIIVNDADGTSHTEYQTTTSTIVVSTAEDNRGQILGGTRDSVIRATDGSTVSSSHKDLSPLQAAQNTSASGLDFIKSYVRPTFLQNIKSHKVGTGGVLLGVGATVGCAITACPAWLVPGAAVVGGVAALWDFGTHP